MPFDIVGVLSLCQKLGVIQHVRDKLMRQTSPAAEKLTEVLDELSKMFYALDEEIVRFLSLYFESEQSVMDGRAVLLGMEVGQSRIRMNEARGHCHKIANIYSAYLKRWFQDTLEQGEAQQLESLFTSLGTVDSDMLRAIEEATTWLTREAEQVLDLVDLDNKRDANQHIRVARKEVRNTRRELTSAMAELRALQAEFISASRIV